MGRRRRRPGADRHHRLRPGRARRRRVRRAAGVGRERDGRTPSCARGRVDEVGVGDLRAGHRHASSRRTRRSTTRPSRSTPTPTARAGSSSSRWPIPRRSTSLLDAAAYQRLVEEGPDPRRVRASAESSRPGAWSTTSAEYSTPRARWRPTRRCSTTVAAGAPPVLRLYRWCAARAVARALPARRPTSTSPTCRARLGVEVVRRPTGGRGLLHGGDLTYAVAMPLPERAPRARSIRRSTPWPRRADRRASPASGSTAAIAPSRRPRGPGLLRRPTGRGPPRRRPQALRVGPGAPRRRRPPARLGAARAPAVRRDRPPPCPPRAGPEARR